MSRIQQLPYFVKQRSVLTMPDVLGFILGSKTNYSDRDDLWFPSILPDKC